ncbi:MAG: alpha/beta hydrolase [Fretibacterium sp.]|nr:alpha/beta hydrolase [Fretibacterium sp.]
MRPIILGQDAPVSDRENPPGLAGFSCPSEDDVLYGSVYYAEGKNSPTVVLCHGFPGAEKNGDLAQVLRQAGFNVVLFSYRGAWGSRGAFSFSGVAVDACNVVRHILRGKAPWPERFGDRVVLVGFSMGAFAALRASRILGTAVRDVALLAVWNIGREVKRSLTDPETRSRIDALLLGAGCLAGVSRASLWNELLRNPEEFDLRFDATACGDKRILMVDAEEDREVLPEESRRPLAEMLRRVGASLTERMLPGDHAFSAQRWSLARLLLNWLEEGGY